MVLLMFSIYFRAFVKFIKFGFIAELYDVEQLKRFQRHFVFVLMHFSDKVFNKNDKGVFFVLSNLKF